MNWENLYAIIDHHRQYTTTFSQLINP